MRLLTFVSVPVAISIGFASVPVANSIGFAVTELLALTPTQSMIIMGVLIGGWRLAYFQIHLKRFGADAVNRDRYVGSTYH